MREIKFRAWDHEDEFMIYSDAEYDDHFFAVETVGVKAYRIYMDFRSHLDPPEPETEELNVMQFTGLKDKNGTDIYEGDILNHETTFENNMADRRFQSHTEVRVGFENGCFIDFHTKIKLYAKIYSIVEHKIDFEVIGNFYENPELIN